MEKRRIESQLEYIKRTDPEMYRQMVETRHKMWCEYENGRAPQTGCNCGAFLVAALTEMKQYEEAQLVIQALTKEQKLKALTQNHDSRTSS